MNLRIFFDALNNSDQQNIFEFNNWVNSIQFNNGTFPDLYEVEIAIIGVNESPQNPQPVENPADIIRKKLYSLSMGLSNQLKIVDLGNLRNGIDQEETIARLKEVVEILLQKEIFPIIIGGSHQLDVGQFLGYEYLEKPISMVNVDAFLDIDPFHPKGNIRSHINKILTNKTFPLFH